MAANPFLRHAILHVSGVQSAAEDQEIMSILGDLGLLPARAKLERSFTDLSAPATGTIEFREFSNAEKALAIVQNCHLRSSISPLSLHINADGKDELPAAKPRLLKGVGQPVSISSVYDLFRPFGPICRCTLAPQPDPCAIIEFYDEQDAQKAVSELHCSTFEGQTITVQVYKPPAVKPRVSLPGASSQLLRKSQTSANGELPIDHKNLTIQNLGKSISGRDLFNAFKPFGRIVSARHMTTPDGELRGFGFVSFEQERDAAAALKAMNGAKIRSFETGEERVMTIAFHRQKKASRGAKASNGLDEDMARHMNGLVVDPNMMSTPMLRQASSSSSASSSPSLSPDRPRSERDRLVAAISRLETDPSTVEKLTELIMSLPKADRALCIFNSSILAAKVADAREVLHAMSESAEESKPTIEPEMEKPTSLAGLAALSPAQILKLIGDGLSLDGVVVVDGEAIVEVDKLVDSVASKTVTEQKQRIGERIFRALKQQGIKSAPKRAVALLDENDTDLRALAHLVNQPEILKLKALSHLP